MEGKRVLVTDRSPAISGRVMAAVSAEDWAALAGLREPDTESHLPVEDGWPAAEYVALGQLAERSRYNAVPTHRASFRALCALDLPARAPGRGRSQP
jgi:hypothetical protein